LNILHGNAVVRGNEEAGKLARQALVDGVFCLDRGDILKKVIDKFEEAENEENNNNEYIQRMREIGVREGEGRQSVLKGKTKSFTIS
jgi:hypothetical protein